MDNWNELKFSHVRNIFQCGGLRETTERAIASACYNRVYTYGAVITSFCFIGSSFILVLLSFITFMELMVDKTVLRKFEELSNKKKTGAVGAREKEDDLDNKIEMV